MIKNFKEEQFQHENFDLSNLLENLSHNFVVSEMERIEDQEKKKGGKKKVNRISDIKMGMNLSGKEEFLFDPSPLIETFQEALNQLNGLNENVNEKIQALTEKCEEEEKLYQKQMKIFQLNFSSYHSELLDLDKRMSKVTNIAVQIGDRLSGADAKRISTTEASDIMEYYSEMNLKGKSDSPIFSDSGTIQDRAILLKKLNLLAFECQSIERMQKANKAIQNYSKQLENELLENIKQLLFAENEDDPSLKHYIHTICEFNGGESCITLYINSIEEKISPKYEAKIEEVQNKNLNNSFEEKKSYERIIGDFFSSVYSVLSKEISLIQKVFPKPPVVFSKIVSHLFASSSRENNKEPLSKFSIKNLLDCIEEKMVKKEPKNYLRSLSYIHDETKEITEKLEKLIPQFNQYNSPNFIDLLFNSAREHYGEREISYLQTTYNSYLSDFRKMTESRNLEINSPSENLKSPISPRKKTKKEEKEKESVNLLVSNPSLENIEFTKFFVTENQQSAERIEKLSNPQDIAKNVSKIYLMMLKMIEEEYNSCLNLHLKKMTVMHNKRKERLKVSEIDFLSTALQTNLVVISIETYHYNVVMNILKQTSNINVCAKCEESKNSLLQSIESKVENGLKLTIDLIENNISYLLKKNQKKSDYKFTDSSNFTPGITPACKLTSSYILEEFKKASNCLDGFNLQVFLEKLGTIFAAKLFRHLSKLHVTAGLGGSKLFADINHYKSLANKFQNEDVDMTFSELTKLINIHMVEKNNVMLLLQDLKFKKFGKAEIKKYLKTHQFYIPQWDDLIDCII
eukprot:TRINITY_DN6801_c0_g1_i1.p1 TRINITY_DN6801_c0_g1~~TRINITY_DN6801_c0_g1_i1.p1  ORF type:complete len:800 (+),score=270.92 TRINITY_DN6801_c0_g1_i1:36-2435(+)